LNLQAGACDYVGVAIHELGHTLGMAHEHMRPDRDSYLTVHWDNIKSYWKSQFNMIDASHIGGRYDLGSIMHYKNNAGAKDRKKRTMTPIKDKCHKKRCPKMGQRDGLSKGDQEQLADMYGADSVGIWTSKMECVDQPFFKSTTTELDCKKYVSEGKCSEAAYPCCGCDDGGW